MPEAKSNIETFMSCVSKNTPMAAGAIIDEVERRMRNQPIDLEQAWEDVTTQMAYHMGQKWEDIKGGPEARALAKEHLPSEDTIKARIKEERQRPPVVPFAPPQPEEL